MVPGTYRGKVKGGTVVLEGDVSLEDGTEVIVTPVLPKPGTGAAIVAAMAAAPQVPRECVDELERLIDERQRAPSKISP